MVNLPLVVVEVTLVKRIHIKYLSCHSIFHLQMSCVYSCSENKMEQNTISTNEYSEISCRNEVSSIFDNFYNNRIKVPTLQTIFL